MKTTLFQSLLTAFVALTATFGFSQTTAMNFSGPDCNGNPVNLFSDLDGGKAVMLIFYMPNCGSCPPVATKMQTMANNINATHPGLVKAYAFPFQNTTTCAYSADWVTNNNLPLFAPMDSGAVQVAYYGGFGMPTVVLLGGDNQDVLFVTQDFNNADTTTMRDLILGTFTAGVAEQAITGLTAYPNPATAIINVNFTIRDGSEALIELTNLSGKQMLVRKEEALSDGLVEKQLDVTGIPAGTYILRISTGESVVTQKVNITH